MSSYGLDREMNHSPINFCSLCPHGVSIHELQHMVYERHLCERLDPTQIINHTSHLKLNMVCLPGPFQHDRNV